jgi:carbamoylphosphate synthase large subunit
MQQTAYRLEDLAGQKVICYGTGSSSLKQQFLQRIVRAGVDLTILKFPGESVMPDAPCKVIGAEWNDTGVLQSPNGIVYNGALTYDELHVMRLSRAGSVFNLENQPLSIEVAGVCRDKRLMKERFLQHNIPTAPHALWKNERELSLALGDLGLTDHDYILKPALGAASAGVLHVHKGELLEDAVGKFRALCATGVKKAGYFLILEPPFLVEKYIQHYDKPVELSVDGYVHNGEFSEVIVSEKVDMVTTGVFTENKYVSPPLSDFVTADIDDIVKIASSAVKALGIDNSVFHCEIRYDDDKINILEVGSRPGGGLISESAVYRTGVDLRLQHLLLAIGMPLQQVQRTEQATCFGTLYYEPEFSNLANLEVVCQIARDEGLFFEARTDPQHRKDPLLDWLIGFGVTGDSPKDSYSRFYSYQDRFKGILR